MGGSSLKRFIMAGAFIVLLPAVCFAIPHLINYQGRLTDDSGVPVNGSRPVVFSLYTTASGGTALWTEGKTVTAADGVFSVELGSVTGIPSAAFMTDNVYLGIKVGTDAEMTPRQRLTSVGYAFTADSASYANSAGTATSATSATNATMANDSYKLNGKDGAWYASASHGHDSTYVNETDHTKAAHDAIAINADLVDGQHASDIIDAASDEVRTAISAVPVTISAAGSYYFAGNLTYTPTTGTAINITADNVTIDMMGFSLIGPTGTPVGGNIGISMVDRKNVEIRNGTVRDFRSTGIYAAELAGVCNGIRIINVRIINNQQTGISLAGGCHLVKDCTVYDNYGTGISLGSYGLAAGNVVKYNGGNGISASYGSTISGNVCYDNGYSGIYVSYYCTVSDNTVYLNAENGIYGYTGNLITGNTLAGNNTSDLNLYAGIRVYYSNTVKGNKVRSTNRYNIYVSGNANTIEENISTDAVGTGDWGFYFNNASNFYANNRASNASGNYGGTLPTGAGDGGGNVSF